jgi:hypothetical protein
MVKSVESRYIKTKLIKLIVCLTDCLLLQSICLFGKANLKTCLIYNIAKNITI